MFPVSTMTMMIVRLSGSQTDNYFLTGVTSSTYTTTLMLLFESRVGLHSASILVI